MIKFAEQLRQSLLDRARLRQENLPKTLAELFSTLNDLDETRATCLAFLLAELPETDLLNYELSYFLQHIEQSLRSYDFAPWKEQISAEMFLVYILMPRVNTEPLVLHRDYFRQDLSERVAALSLEEAIIESNYYCYSKGTYQSTDGRTVSPLVFVDRAGGRCGEESVFVVSVLRSLAIPARQMYSPYWAHTDDNHAWVEAWTGKEWAYFGACEPEAVLNCGWFDGSARRAKLILSRTFCELKVPGDDYLEGAIPFGLVNQSRAYFTPLSFELSLKNGKEPLKNIVVNLEILNYASDSPILAVKTDDTGHLKLDIAEGTILINFTFGGLTFEKWINLQENCKVEIDVRTELEIILNAEYISKGNDNNIIEILLDQESEIEAPLKDEVQFALLKNSEQEKGLFVAPSIKDVKQGEVAQEVMIKHQKKYEAAKKILDSTNDSFYKLSEKAEEDDIDMGLVRNRAGKDRDIDNVLHWARLNQKKVEYILSPESKANDKQEYTLEEKLQLFTVLSNKDIADINEEVFYDHMTAFNSMAECISREKIDQEIWQKYTLSPRFERENLSAWREYFNSVLSDEQKETWRKNPILIDEWVRENITTPNTSDYGGIYVQPENCYHHLRGNAWSKRILTLAIARSIGLAAYSESMSLRPMFIKKGQAYPFRQEDILIEGDPKDKAKLKLIKKNKNEQFAYSSQFTIKQLANKNWRHINPENLELIENESSYALMDPGIYALNIVKRLQNGDQLYKRYFFRLEKGVETSLILALPEEEQERGQIDLAKFELKKVRRETGEELQRRQLDDKGEKKALPEGSATAVVSSRELFQRGKRIFIFLEAKGEPYSHLINDLSQSITDLTNYADKIVVALASVNDLEEPRLAKFLKDLDNVEYYIMKEDLPKYLYNKYCCSLRELPLVTMFSDEAKLIFASTGYRINTDQELLQRLR